MIRIFSIVVSISILSMVYSQEIQPCSTQECISKLPVISGYLVTPNNSEKEISAFVDLNEIRIFAQASKYAYQVDSSSKGLNSEVFSRITDDKNLIDPMKYHSFYEAGYKVLLTGIFKKSGLRAVSFYQEKTKTLLVAFKGSDSAKDFYTSLGAMVSNIFETPEYQNILKDADTFLKLSKSRARCAKTVVTGHSLGGFVAAMLAYNNRNILARVFSSPGVYVVSNPKTSLPNVINFIRQYDMASYSLSDYAENRVYYKANSSYNPWYSHDFTLFLRELLSPAHKDKSTGKLIEDEPVAPVSIRFTSPVIIEGFGVWMNWNKQ